MAPKSCAYALKIGRRFPRLSPSAYKICVTPTQAAELFGTTRKPKKIACGTFACAYEHPTDVTKVVKITRDPSDVAGLERAQGLQVPKLFKSRKLAGKPKWVTPRTATEHDDWPKQPTAYALTLERLQPLPERERWRWNMRFSFMRALLDPNYISTAAAKAGVKPPATIGELAERVCVDAGDAAETAQCQLRIRELNKISTDLRARGVDWADIHAGNIGVDANGRWKALDLGASPTPLVREPPILHGRKR